MDRQPYNSIKHIRVNGIPAFLSDGVRYFYLEDDSFSKECARLAAEMHAPLVPDFLIEEIDPIGEGQFRNINTGKIWSYPRADACRRRIALDSAILYKATQPPQTAIANYIADYNI